MTNKTFIHAFGTNDKLKIENFCSTQTQNSLLVLDLILNCKGENPMYMDLNILRTNPMQNLKDYPISTRLFTVIKGAEYRNKKNRSNEENETIKWADIELAFEESRRQTVNFPPSRLSALYLADDNKFGIKNIKEMFGEMPIFRVEILNNLQIHKADVRWYEEYGKDYDIQYISNYWNGIAYDKDNPRWEYLLEGTINYIEQIK